MKLTSRISGSWLFLIGVCTLYVVAFFTNPAVFSSGVLFFYDLVLKILPVFILVFVLMALTNYFVTPAAIVRRLEARGVTRWIVAIVGGILSTGPIYMWYPFLADLKDKGLKNDLIACFLYNRAIKIPLLPVMILYFSWKYILVLTLVMIVVSVVQGLLIGHAMDKSSKALNAKKELKIKYSDR